MPSTDRANTHVRVEYFGTIRLRTGVDADEVHARTVGELLRKLVRHRRALVPEVLCPDGTPRSALLILNERHLVRDLSQPLRPGDRLLLANPDVGG